MVFLTRPIHCHRIDPGPLPACMAAVASSPSASSARRRTKTLLSRLLSSSTPANGGGGGVAVKQVTRGNLAEALGELRDAAFVGLDLEMSGVTSAPWRDTFELDRADVRCLKLRDSAERFAAVHLGVCPFRWDPAKSAFVAHPHNFFLSSLARSSQMIVHLWSQTTSIDFLAKYQFDFNMCFSEGISYLSRAQEEYALDKLNILYHDRILASPNTSEEEGDVPKECCRSSFHGEDEDQIQ